MKRRIWTGTFWRRSGCWEIWKTRRGKMLQIIMSGQPELDRKLEEREYRQLKQRIALRCHLRPFNALETSQYIASRLRRAGMAEQTVFPPDVLAEIHCRTQGIPRLINSVCDNLLLTSFAMESKVARRGDDRRSFARSAPRMARREPNLVRRRKHGFAGTASLNRE